MPEAGRPDVPVPVAAPGEDPDWLPPEINTGVAHPARVYDYLLGGKDNYAADRVLGESIIKAMPSTVLAARANRAFLGRAVRYLAGQAGIRQFLDIGTGIPTAGNTHEVAQAATPQARVVYVDNDPIVMAHARALMDSDPAGVTAFIQADLRDPAKILASPALRATLDLGQPVALMLIAILHFLADQDNAREIVAELLGALPSGSFLAVTHSTADFSPGEITGVAEATRQAGVRYTPRSQAEVAAFFDGLDLLEPGVVPVMAWRPDGPAPENPRAAYIYAALARKP
ncbi:MAG TPA: SAM-dependent methyltransferase [Trebonia sp.]|nr:SAM-dependent methyltransferase [Trebonia sp.]